MNAITQAKKAIENQYRGVCSITEYQSYKKENKSTGYQEVIVLEHQPCKLSYSSIKNANSTDTATSLTQVIKLFISPDIEVKPGSKIIITQDNRTTEYKNSGMPAIYRTHQEIVLELFKGWS